MKKQKSNIIVLALVICLSIACMFTLTACRSEEHTHSYADAWTYNETHHWKEATCEHTTEKGEYAEHSLTDNACACGYVSVTYTVADANAWNEVLTGDYLSNVTCVAENNAYKDDVLLESEANGMNMKITENAILQAVSAHGQSQTMYVVKKDNAWYRLSKNQDAWYGMQITEQQVAAYTIVGGLGAYFVDKFSSFVYDSENKCYVAENLNLVGNTIFDYVKICIENGKLISVEMKRTVSADQYVLMQYTFTNYGTTVLEDVPQFTVNA